MGIGPISAVRKLYQRTGLTTEDIDVFEANEAFAAQVLAVRRELELPPEKTNPNGSGISLGHPSRGNRCNRDGESTLRTASNRRALCAGDHVHRRRAGDCGGL
jgi:hypothetical protein